jgi:hypothetical protein
LLLLLAFGSGKRGLRARGNHLVFFSGKAVRRPVSRFALDMSAATISARNTP